MARAPGRHHDTFKPILDQPAGEFCSSVTFTTMQATAGGTYGQGRLPYDKSLDRFIAGPHDGVAELPGWSRRAR